MRLDRVSGDRDKVEGGELEGGEGPEEAGGHGQEVALHTRESDEVVDDLENLIEDQHSVVPVESGGVEVVDLSSQTSQAFERGQDISRLHSFLHSFLTALRWDNRPLQGPSKN